jgi:hypothetical protein
LLTGVEVAGSRIWSRPSTALWSTRKDKAMSVRCARERERCQRRQKSGEGSGLTGIVDSLRRHLWDGTLDFTQPGGRERERKGEGGRGDRGDFIGAKMRRIRQGINRIEGEKISPDMVVSCGDFGQRLGMMRWPDMRGPDVSEEKRRDGTILEIC